MFNACVSVVGADAAGEGVQERKTHCKPLFFLNLGESLGPKFENVMELFVFSMSEFELANSGTLE